MLKKELIEMINEMPEDSKVFVNGEEITIVLLRKEKSGISDFLSKNEIYIQSKNQSR
jgi:hypothetical protein